MAYVIKLVAMPVTYAPIDPPEYVRSYNPDAYGGAGYLDTTRDPAKAQRFATNVDAMAEWKRPSTVKPLRMDGKPNRPMTMYTVEISQLPEGEEQQ